jgi:hypothetical protein
MGIHMLADDILLMLRDGRWHDVGEIMHAFDQQGKIVDHVLKFCEVYGFIEFDKARSKVTINSKIQQLFFVTNNM